jgi:CheY-like chemotaxis protein
LTHARVEADPSQIEQVLMNLVVNARDAIRGEGRVTVEVEVCEVGSGSPPHAPELAPGRHVVIGVSDTGEGMDEETQEHIFEPFFTTKPQGSGTGLGLSTVFGIVKQSGGSIRLFSEPGHGSSFRIYLPVCEQREFNPERPPCRPPHRGTGRILVVEDDVQLRKVVVAILRSAGYEPIAPLGPVEGLAIAKQCGDDIALLLTDVMMPQMTGIQLADALKKAGSPMPVLFMSGYAEDSVVQHGVLQRGINFIPKPLTPEKLLQAVRDVLVDTAVNEQAPNDPSG